MASLPKTALGAWAWGNDGTSGNDITADSLKPIFDTAMANGLNLWDTAYAYGMGTSDKFTPQCANGKPVLFEFPTYEYFVTGETVGSCGKMN